MKRRPGDSRLTDVLRSALSARRLARKRTQVACVKLVQKYGISEIEADSVLTLVGIGYMSENENLQALAQGVAVLHDIDLSSITPITSAVHAREEASKATNEATHYLGKWLHIDSGVATEGLLLLLERAAEHGVLRAVAERWTNEERISWDSLTSAITGDGKQSR